MPKIGDEANLFCEKCKKKTPHVCTQEHDKIGKEGILSEWKCKKCGLKKMHQLG